MRDLRINWDLDSELNLVSGLVWSGICSDNKYYLASLDTKFYLEVASHEETLGLISVTGIDHTVGICQQAMYIKNTFDKKILKTINQNYFIGLYRVFNWLQLYNPTSYV